MAPTLELIFPVLLILLSLSHAQQSNSKPKALLLSVSKDLSTLQYLTHLNIGTPSLQKTLVVDLGSRYLWLDCANRYKSSTYKVGICGSAACSAGKYQGCGFCISPSSPSCNKSTCSLVAKNPISDHSDFGILSTDKISLHSTDGSKSGPPVSISNYIFSCVTDSRSLLPELARGSKGMIGLGRHPASLPLQLSSSFGGSFRRKFAICLPSNPKSNGVIFFGDSPYVFYPGYNKSKAIDFTTRFTYTRLYISPVSLAVVHQDREPSAEYFVRISSITVNRKPIQMNTTLLSIDSRGIGGTTISTVTPYTLLESTIYKALVQVFDEEIISTWKVSKVKPVAPFNDCYTMGNLGMSLIGLSVPNIAIVFENKDEVWDIYGANSVVQISSDVVCLGFLDGGLDVPRASIVIGAHQLQNNLFQFDLAASKLGFTSTLLLEEAECSNFNF